MNRPVSRRWFLKGAAVAPVVVKSGALKELSARIDALTAANAAGLLAPHGPDAFGAGRHLMSHDAIYAA